MLEQAELTEVGDEDEIVLTEVAEGLGFVGEGVEAVVGGLDFDDAALGVGEGWRLGIAWRTAGLREEASVGHACALTAELGGEENFWLEGVACGVEETVERRIERCFGGGGAGIANGSVVCDVLRYGLRGGGHGVYMMA